MRLRAQHRLGRDGNSGFSLVELLVVMGVIVLLSAFALPALTGLKTAQDVSSGAYAIAAALDRAKTFAVANHTYVWLGFYEEDANSTVPSTAKPPYRGAGRVVIASVYSVDGTALNSGSSAPGVLASSEIRQLGSIIKIPGIHLTDIGAPSGSGDAIELRPGFAYSPDDPAARINSDADQASDYPFSTQGYEFYKTVRFSPSGEALVNGATLPKHAAEIGIRLARTNTVDNRSKYVAAVQVTGLAGGISVYRR